MKKQISVILSFIIDDNAGIGQELKQWHYTLYRDGVEISSGSVLNLEPLAIDSALTKKAVEKGACQQWVTPDGGYTQLPDKMIEELGLVNGGYLWFLKGSRWEAWQDSELDKLFGLGSEE